ncbi:MAG: hypothetical protein B7C24_01125 [Bacteroidetes bacterium 4572_77]|nr:MAG: hypothetical protein B7C24_01125 [Bacteroidetes bacterium 4572_77]
MKSIDHFFRSNFLALLLLISLFLGSSAWAQEYSTRGEIYDFDIGDIFQIEFWETSASGGHSDIDNIEIVDKYYSEEEDTVFYTRYIKHKYSSSDYPEWQYSYYYDTVYYYDLDNIFDADNVFIDEELYNGRKISQWLYDAGYLLIENRFADGLGEVKYHYDFWHPEEWGESLRKLTYYKKGEEEWGNHQIVAVDNNPQNDLQIKVYPNPASEIINFDFGDKYTNYYQLQIFSPLGSLIKSILINNNTICLNISHLNSGVYFYRIVDQKENIQITDKLLIK